MMKNRVVAIVGLGLMGGSLAMALRGKCRAVWGVARRAETVQHALALGAIDEGTTDLAQGLASADLAILAAPVRAIVELVPRAAAALRPGGLLMDLGSTKQQIMAALESVPPHVQTIGGHPLCGKEASGLDAAQADLYRDRVFVLTPGARTTPSSLALAGEMVRAVGARPVVMDAGLHDRLVAAISHLPYLQAAALAQVAGEVAAGEPLTWHLAASGFRDTSRLAASDVTMMLDIMLTNHANVAALARQTARFLEALAAQMEAGDEAGLRRSLEEARGAVMTYRTLSGKTE